MGLITHAGCLQQHTASCMARRFERWGAYVLFLLSPPHTPSSVSYLRCISLQLRSGLSGSLQSARHHEDGERDPSHTRDGWHHYPSASRPSRTRPIERRHEPRTPLFFEREMNAAFTGPEASRDLHAVIDLYRLSHLSQNQRSQNQRFIRSATPARKLNVKKSTSLGQGPD